MMITSLAVAREIFSMGQTATFVGVSLENPYQAESIADQIKKITAQDKISTYHWMAVAADMFNSLSFYRKIVIIVLFMSILITAFNIYTTLNIMILERKKQIGVLMSMGIKKFSLYRLFLIVSQKEAIIGIVSGILLGVFLGYYFSDYFNRSLEAFLQIREAGTLLHTGTVVFIFGFVCLVCGLTAAAATRKGANLDPVEALRSE
jgi:lipoprotein-releasing system permease protein